jgi:DnaJ like chaperone protein
MSIWTRISEALAALAKGESLAQVFERLRTPPERSVGFTIAVIALGAKMAKADGQVSRSEVSAFREIFQIASADEANAARVYNLARQDVAGFEVYARQVRALFADDHEVLNDLLEGLFHIAVADGFYHPNENDFLEEVAQIFGVPDARFAALRCRFVPDAEPDPYVVLGVDPDTPLEEIRAVWRKLVRDTHPDAMVARGLPEEAVRLAEKRMIAINRAWEQVSS